MAAGMAAQGLVPVAAIYSTFLQRAYDQIVHDIAIEGLHVVLCVDRAGIVGADGATHNGVLDIAFLRSIPGVKIFCPSDFAELRVMLSRAIYRETGPVAIRYPRGSEGAYRKELSAQPLVCVHEQSGSEVTIVTHGIMVNQAIDAAEILMHEGIRAQVYKVNEIGSGLEQAYAEVKEKAGRLVCRCGRRCAERQRRRVACRAPQRAHRSAEHGRPLSAARRRKRAVPSLRH